MNENILVARFGTKRCNAKYTLNCPCGFLGAVIYTARFSKSSFPHCIIRQSLLLFLPCGCVRMVAELLFGHQTPFMLPRSISGVLWAAQVGYVVHPG